MTAQEEAKKEQVKEGLVKKEPAKEEQVKSGTAVVGTEKKGTEKKLALVLVRGLVGVTKAVKDTLLMLRLTRKNNCVVVDNNAVYLGMIHKVKDYITWGEINEDTFKELLSKRGQEYVGRESDRKNKYKTYKTLNVNNKKYKLYFRLNPPRKGFGRKGIKVAFKVGGGLGYRGEKINDLIKRML